jgi:hypothetical protein
MMLRAAKRIVRGLAAAGICLAFSAHCGNVTINKKVARGHMPDIGWQRNSG